MEKADNAPRLPFLFVLPGRVLQEQLCELTRLVLKLPEVDGLLQRAGLQATATRTQPAQVLEVFVKVTGVESGADLRGRGGRAVLHDHRQNSTLTDFHTFLFFFYLLQHGVRR